MEKETKVLIDLCEPIVGYLRKNHNPYINLLISQDSIRFVNTEVRIPIKSKND